MALNSHIQILSTLCYLELKLKLLSDSHIDMIRFPADFNHTAIFSKLSVNTAFTTARHVIFLVEVSDQLGKCWSTFKT
jgi:hypothetical protein